MQRELMNFKSIVIKNVLHFYYHEMINLMMKLRQQILKCFVTQMIFIL